MPSPLDQIRGRLTRALSTRSAILVTGAGFSAGVINRAGTEIPSVSGLISELWALTSNDRAPEFAALGDVFAVARVRDEDATVGLMRRLCSVDPLELDEARAAWFRLPWRRIYTFNIDDLAEQIASRFPGVTIEPLSALRASSFRESPGSTQYVHVNGDLDDLPDVTFSEQQYAERLARRDPWLLQLAAELQTLTVVFVGTTAREPHLWQAVQQRRIEHHVLDNDPRPLGFLVSPQLDPARRELLSHLNIEFVEGTGDSFRSDVLEGLEIRAPASPDRQGRAWWQPIALDSRSVADDTDYLLGREPRWSDIRQHAPRRQFETGLIDKAAESGLLLYGTPGSGKTTTLMRLALTRRAQGRVVRFVDAERIERYGDLQREVAREVDEYDLFIDNAELVRSWLPRVASSFRERFPDASFAAAISKRAFSWLELDAFHPLPAKCEVPLLQPSDVSALVTILESAGMLGRLEGQDRPTQEAELARRSGLQLVVAMIEATRGEQHSDRLHREYDELPAAQRLLYATACVAREVRYRTGVQELLIAAGLTARIADIEALRRAGVLVEISGDLVPRHARVAEIIVHYARARNELLSPYIGLAQALSTRHDIGKRLTSATRALTHLISHDRVRTELGADRGRQFYAALVPFMRRDYHYWLQRGNFELSLGNPRGARPFLASARARSASAPDVDVAWADMLFAEALTDRDRLELQVRQAFGDMDRLFNGFGLENAYPWGVAAKGLLNAARSDHVDPASRREFLEVAINEVLREGQRLHPRDVELRRLRGDVLRESAKRRAHTKTRQRASRSRDRGSIDHASYASHGGGALDPGEVFEAITEIVSVAHPSGRPWRTEDVGNALKVRYPGTSVARRAGFGRLSELVKACPGVEVTREREVRLR